MLAKAAQRLGERTGDAGGDQAGPGGERWQASGGGLRGADAEIDVAVITVGPGGAQGQVPKQAGVLLAVAPADDRVRNQAIVAAGALPHFGAQAQLATRQAFLGKTAELAGQANIAHAAQRRGAAGDQERRAAGVLLPAKADLGERTDLPAILVHRVPAKAIGNREEDVILIIQAQIGEDRQAVLAAALPHRRINGREADAEGPGFGRGWALGLCALQGSRHAGRRALLGERRGCSDQDQGGGGADHAQAPSGMGCAGDSGIITEPQCGACRQRPGTRRQRAGTVWQRPGTFRQQIRNRHDGKRNQGSPHWLQDTQLGSTT